jgi:hypothetical protein
MLYYNLQDTEIKLSELLANKSNLFFLKNYFLTSDYIDVNIVFQRIKHNFTPITFYCYFYLLRIILFSDKYTFAYTAITTSLLIFFIYIRNDMTIENFNFDTINTLCYIGILILSIYLFYIIESFHTMWYSTKSSKNKFYFWASLISLIFLFIGTLLILHCLLNITKDELSKK